MLIVGYVFAIRSERQSCSEVQVNLAHWWFCQLGVEDGMPDHSVFSGARHERLRQRYYAGYLRPCWRSGLPLVLLTDPQAAWVAKRERRPGGGSVRYLRKIRI